MENGDIDLLIIPAQYVSPNHPSGALYEETCVCVTWKGKRRIRRMSVEEYSAAEHVATHFGGGRMPAFDSWIMERDGISRRLAVVTPWLIYPARMVVGTDRIATVHRRLAELDARHLPIKLWKPPIAIPNLVESMQWHRVRGQGPALAWLRGIILSVAAVI